MAHATLDHQLVPVLTTTASRDQDDLTVVEQPSLDNVTEIKDNLSKFSVCSDYLGSHRISKMPLLLLSL